jgi:hypothetical protein
VTVRLHPRPVREDNLYPAVLIERSAHEVDLLTDVLVGLRTVGACRTVDPTEVHDFRTHKKTPE